MTPRDGHGIYPDKPRPGDRVAILSASSGLPEVYPAVFEQGLKRLREMFDLDPVEYPSTRSMGASLPERARDVEAACADPEIKAMICSIGGEEQIKLLKYLDPDVLAAHPKPFFGYSDNTNLHLFLWNLGLVSYHGGSIMVEFGRGGMMHPFTGASLRQALFTRGEVEIEPASEYTDENVDWGTARALTEAAPMLPGTGWTWLNEGQSVTGVAWGGNLEIIDFHLRASRYLLPLDAYDGAILFLETSEELPSATYVYRVLMGMGERGLLQRFAAILVGRPKAWSFERPNTLEERARYAAKQEAAILRAIAEYHPHVLTVFNLDIGHTDPQLVIPSGGAIRIDGVQRRIWVTY